MGNWFIPCKRALLIHPEGNTYNNPTLKGIIDLLKEKEIWIDIRYKNTIAPMPESPGVGLMPYGNLVAKFKSLVVNRLSSKYLTIVYVFIEKVLLYKKFDLIIGVDRQGLVEASLLSMITNTPYVFISFEIMFESETSHRFKRIELAASKNVSLWVVQDEIRFQCLYRENLLPKERAFLLPLASEGKGGLSSKRLRDKLGIPVEKKVAIVIGSITQWAMTKPIIESLSRWPDDWVLIVHDRYGRTTEILSNSITSNSDVINSKLYVSDCMAEMIDDMGYIFAGVSAGLAFYEPDNNGPYTGNNLRYLGLASGKISTYLRYGVPVILNHIGLFAEHAEKYGFGLVINHPDDLPGSLEQLHVERMKINAAKYFTERLDFKIYRDLLWRELCRVVGRMEATGSSINRGISVPEDQVSEGWRI